MLSRCTGACACSAWRCCDASRRLRPPRGLRRPRRPLVPGRTSLFRTTRRCPALPRTPRRRRPRKNIPPRSHPGNGTVLKDKLTIFPRCETILLHEVAETTNLTKDIQNQRPSKIRPINEDSGPEKNLLETCIFEL